LSYKKIFRRKSYCNKYIYIKMLMGQDAFKLLSDVTDVSVHISGPRLRRERDQALRDMAAQKEDYEGLVGALKNEFQHTSDVHVQKLHNTQLDGALKVKNAESDAVQKVQKAESDAVQKVQKAELDATLKVRQKELDTALKLKQTEADTALQLKQTESDAALKLKQTESDAALKLKQTESDAALKLQQASSDLRQAQSHVTLREDEIERLKIGAMKQERLAVKQERRLAETKRLGEERVKKTRAQGEKSTKEAFIIATLLEQYLL
jgi:hypothetical protein